MCIFEEMIKCREKMRLQFVTNSLSLHPHPINIKHISNHDKESDI